MSYNCWLGSKRKGNHLNRPVVPAPGSTRLLACFPTVCFLVLKGENLRNGNSCLYGSIPGLWAQEIPAKVKILTLQSINNHLMRMCLIQFSYLLSPNYVQSSYRSCRDTHLKQTESWPRDVHKEDAGGVESRWRTRGTWNSRLHATRAPTRHRWGATDT